MRRKIALWSAVCLLLAVAMLTPSTVAWLSKSQRADTAFTSLSDFEVTGILSFKEDGLPYEGTSVLAPVSFTPTADNYIGNLKYTVRYTGSSPAYIRVRVLEQWTDSSSDDILPASFLEYKIAPGGNPHTPGFPTGTPTIPAAGPSAENLAKMGEWVDNRKVDYCYYYTVPVQPKLLEAKGEGTATVIGDGTVELTLIDQSENADLIAGIDPTTTEMGLVIEVEAVQPNRYLEFWGISALPF